MVGSNAAPAAAFGAHGHGHHRLAAEHVAVLGGLVGKLIHGQRREVDVHDLGDRAHAGHGRAGGCAGDGGFADRGVDDTIGAELVDQPTRDAVCAAVEADVLAEDEHFAVAHHLLFERLVQRLPVGMPCA